MQRNINFLKGIPMNNEINVVIEGISPLLMHAFPLVPVKGIDKMTMEEQAKHAEYRTADGHLYVPGINIQRCLINGATYSKGKGRASLQKQAAACLLVNPEYVLLYQTDYTIDMRAVVVPATKGRIVRYRPRFEQWKLTFGILYDPQLLSKVELRQIVDDSGSRVGLLDFRPEKKGPFGRFHVTKWEDN